MLIQLERGKISACKGKSLDDIALDENKEVDPDEIDGELELSLMTMAMNTFYL